MKFSKELAEKSKQRMVESEDKPRRLESKTSLIENLDSCNSFMTEAVII